MRKMLFIWTALVILFLNGVPCALSEKGIAQLELSQSYPLQFSKQPIRIERTTYLPQNYLAVFYLAEGDDSTNLEYMMEMFSSLGTSVLSKSFGQYDVDNGPFPYGQILPQQDSFLCEYYPDMTSMEECFFSVYDYSGKILQKETKRKTKRDEAAYVDVVGDFAIYKQAHPADASGSSQLRNVNIVYLPNNYRVPLKIFDWSHFCSFVDNDGNLLIAQMNEHDNLEVLFVPIDNTISPHILEIQDTPKFDSKWTYLNSAVCIGSIIYSHINITSQDSLLLMYDTVQHRIIASSKLSAQNDSEYIASIHKAGSYLLALDGYWDETTQQCLFHISYLNADMERIPLQLKYNSCISIATGCYNSGTEIATIEKDDDLIYLCHYYVIEP